MSKEACHLRINDHFYDDGHVYRVINAKEGTHSGGNIHFTLEDFATNHRTDRHYGHKHHLVTVEPEVRKFSLSFLLDCTDGKQFLSLLDTKTCLGREDLFVTDAQVIADLQDHFATDDPEPLDVIVERVSVEKLHRDGSDYHVERVIFIEGIDMSHLYDHHRNKHHVHAH